MDEEDYITEQCEENCAMCRAIGYCPRKRKKLKRKELEEGKD